MLCASVIAATTPVVRFCADTVLPRHCEPVTDVTGVAIRSLVILSGAPAESKDLRIDSLYALCFECIAETLLHSPVHSFPARPVDSSAPLRCAQNDKSWDLCPVSAARQLTHRVCLIRPSVRYSAPSPQGRHFTRFVPEQASYFLVIVNSGPPPGICFLFARDMLCC